MKYLIGGTPNEKMAFVVTVNNGTRQTVSVFRRVDTYCYLSDGRGRGLWHGYNGVRYVLGYPMKIDLFPGCCNAYVLHGFGGTDAAQRMQYRETDSGIDPYPDDQESFIQDAVQRYSDKLLVATTNNEQKVTNKLLKQFGFRRTISMEKRHHAETKLIMWWRRPEV